MEVLPGLTARLHLQAQEEADWVSAREIPRRRTEHDYMKQSGCGQGMSRYAIEDYTQVRQVMTKLGCAADEGGVGPREGTPW